MGLKLPTRNFWLEIDTTFRIGFQNCVVFFIFFDRIFAAKVKLTSRKQMWPYPSITPKQLHPKHVWVGLLAIKPVGPVSSLRHSQVLSAYPGQSQGGVRGRNVPKVDWIIREVTQRPTTSLHSEWVSGAFFFEKKPLVGVIPRGTSRCFHKQQIRDLSFKARIKQGFALKIIPSGSFHGLNGSIWGIPVPC